MAYFSGLGLILWSWSLRFDMVVVSLWSWSDFSVPLSGLDLISLLVLVSLHDLGPMVCIDPFPVMFHPPDEIDGWRRFDYCLRPMHLARLRGDLG